MFFKVLLLLLNFSAAEAFDFSQFTCVIKASERYRAILRGTITEEERRDFFLCIQGGVELFQRFFTHSPDRDYFTTLDIAKFFYHYLDYSRDEAYEVSVKALILKKILVGGAVDRLEDENLTKIKNMSYKYGHVSYAWFVERMQKHIPLLISIFQGGGKPSEARLQTMMSRIKDVLQDVAWLYKKHDVVYSLEDLRGIPDYIRVLKLSAADFGEIYDRAAWREGAKSIHFDFAKIVRVSKELGFFSDDLKGAEHIGAFLYFYSRPIFGSHVSGDKWKRFVRSLQPVISMALHYQIHLADKEDMFSPHALPHALTVLDFGLQAMLHIRENPAGKRGFPVENLQGLLAAGLDGGEGGDFLGALRSDSSDSLGLLARSFVCFSLPSPSASCRAVKMEKKGDPLLRLVFPDGEYVFAHSGNFDMRPAARPRRFDIRPDQIDFLRDWIEEFQRMLYGWKTDQGLYGGLRYGFSHWLSGFFGYDRFRRIQFGNIRSPELVSFTAHDFIVVSSFLELLSDPYFEGGSMPPYQWEKFKSEIIPALSAVFNIPYTKDFHRMSSFLFKAGDLLLNSSNQNNKLERGELLDLTVHLMESAKSARWSFRLLEIHCLSMSADCVSQNLIRDPRHLSHFPSFQERMDYASYTPFLSAARDLLPETTSRSFDLAPFFLSVQLTELWFYVLDEDRSGGLSPEELALRLRPSLAKMTDDLLPYTHNRRQGEMYLRYALKEGELPFFDEDPFSAVRFSHWVSHAPDEKEAPVFRDEVFTFLGKAFQLSRGLGGSGFSLL